MVLQRVGRDYPLKVPRVRRKVGGVGPCRRGGESGGFTEEGRPLLSRPCGVSGVFGSLKFPTGSSVSHG